MANRVITGQTTTSVAVSGSGIASGTHAEFRFYNEIFAGGFYVTDVAIKLTKTPTSTPTGDITLTFPDGSTFVSDSYSSSGTSTGLTPTVQTYRGSSANPVIRPPWIYLNDYEHSDFQSTPLSDDVVNGDPEFGMKVSKAGVDVTTATNKQLLFNSAQTRTAQIYAGANALNFYESTTATNPEAVGSTNVISSYTNHSGKKIIIDGTTVTLSTTTTGLGGTSYTSVANMVTDINNANITGITANQRTISASDHRLRITKTASNGAMVITYPTSNSLETVVGINAQTYAVGLLSTNGINYLTATGQTKAGLNYIPLITLSENLSGQGFNGQDEENEDFAYEEIDRLSLWETTNSHMYPVSADADGPSPTDSNANQTTFSVGTPVNRGRSYAQIEDEIEAGMLNASFFVLRIPLGYGYMTSTYFS